MILSFWDCLFLGAMLNFRGVLGDFNETHLKNMRKSNRIILGEFGWVGFGMGFSGCWLNHPSEKICYIVKMGEHLPQFCGMKIPQKKSLKQAPP